jgi:hypothetical protein
MLGIVPNGTCSPFGLEQLYNHTYFGAAMAMNSQCSHNLSSVF